MAFVKATKAQAKLRMALIGPPGSGKTYSALKVGSGLSDRIAVIDTERGSAAKYADKFNFSVLELDSFHPQKYIEAIKEAEAEGFEVLIIDSLSHAWNAKDGALELVDREAKRTGSNNNFTAWRTVTPIHNAMVDAMLGSNLHLMVTMRAKTEYVVEQGPNGKTVIRKVGLQPVQRDGLEYEFDVVGDMTQDNDLAISKSRCEELSGQVFHKPGLEVADILRDWLTSGVPAPDPLEKHAEKSDLQSLVDLAHGYGITEKEEIRTIVRSVTGVENPADLTKRQVGAVVQALMDRSKDGEASAPF